MIYGFLFIILVIALVPSSHGLQSSGIRKVDSTHIQSPITKGGASTVIPQHVGYIVDGNGRWAEARGLDRHHGHTAGARVTVEVAKRSFQLGVEVVTFYLFSTENWSRPVPEVENIMKLLEHYLKEFSSYLRENSIRLVVIGQTTKLPLSVQKLIASMTNEAEDPLPPHSLQRFNQTLCLALSYGGRDDIVSACKSIAQRVGSHELDVESINEGVFAEATATGKLGIPDPDLVIRTSGEFRLSNFLLWQCAYTELSSVDVCWPDFDANQAEALIANFSKRKRRFGAIPAASVAMKKR